MNVERRPIKLAIIGPTSSGKSTLTEVYRRRFENSQRVVVLEEAARVYFDEHPHVVDKPVHTYPVQRELQQFQLQRDVAAHATGAQLIMTEGSVIDPVVFTSFYGDPEGAQKLHNNVLSWLPTYTKFLLMNPENVLYEKDRYRQETPEERLAMFEAFEDFLKERGLPYEVISGSEEERVESVDRILAEEGVIFDRSWLQTSVTEI